MKPYLITPPSVEPLLLDEVKEHLRVDEDADDALIHGLISAVCRHLDGYSGRLGKCLINQTWRLDLPGFSDVMKLPVLPLQSVTSIQYLDFSDVLQTVPDTVYETLIEGEWGGAICRLGNQSWPVDVNPYRAAPVRLTWVAGFGASWNDVPSDIRAAMLSIIADMYEHRGESVIGAFNENKMAQTLLEPHRMVGYA